MSGLLAQTGDVFTIGKSGEFDGFVNGSVAAKVGARYEASIEVCHGIDAGLSAGVVAEVIGKLRKTGVALDVEAKASLEAGLDLEMKVSPHVFEEFGASMQVRAYAEASVAARLAIELQASALVEAVLDASGRADGLARDLAFAFLKQITLEAGVWGKAMVGASAQAYLFARGSLAGEDPGFDIGFGCGAAVKVGKGAELYARLGFVDIGLFYDEAAGLISERVIETVSATLPARSRLTTEFVLRTAMRIAFVAGREQLAETGTDTLRREQDRASFADRCGELAIAELEQLVTSALSSIMDSVVERAVVLLPAEIIKDILLLDEKQVEQIFSRIDTIRAKLDDASAGSAADLASLVDTLTDELRQVSPPLSALIVEVASVIWSALALIGKAPSHTPVAVRQEVLGSDRLSATSQLEKREALDWLITGRGRTLLFKVVPELQELEAQVVAILDPLGIDLWETISGLSEQPREAVRAVIAPALLKLISDWLRALYADDIRPALKREARRDREFGAYFKEVIDPTLSVVPSILDRIFEVYFSDTEADAVPSKTVRRSLGLIASRVIGGQVVILSNVLVNNVLASLSGSMTNLARAVNAGELSNDFDELVEAVVPLIGKHFEGKALEHLAGELLALGREAFGPRIWSKARKRRLLSGIDQTVDELSFVDESSFEAKVNQINDCGTVLAQDQMTDIALTLGDILSDELQLLTSRLDDIIGETFLIAGRETGKVIVDIAVEGVQRALDLAEGLADEIDRRKDRIEDWAKEKDDQDTKFAEMLEKFVEQTLQDLLLALGHLRDYLLDIVEDFVRNAASRLPKRVRENRFYNIDDLIEKARSLVDNLLPANPTIPSTAKDRLSAKVEHLAKQGKLASARPEDLGLTDILNDFFQNSGIRIEVSIPIPNVDALSIPLIESTAERNAIIFNTLSTPKYVSSRDEVVSASSKLAQIEANIANEETKLKDLEIRQRKATEEAAALIPARKPSVDILSPLGIDTSPEDQFTYGEFVPLRLSITGANKTFLDGSTPDRVRIWLNGAQIAKDRLDVRMSQQTLIITASLNRRDGIRSGLNLLRVLVTDGRPQNPRTEQQAIVFVADTSKQLQSPLRVNGMESRFDAPGNDHFATLKESVVLDNTGSRTLQLDAWTLRDAYGHIYRFGDVTLESGESLVLKTGRGRDRKSGTKLILHWNRDAAIWNNRGDTLLITDKNGVVQTEYTYRA